MRFDNHGDTAFAGVRPQFAQARGNAIQNRFPGTLNLVSEYANVGSAKRCGQIDESLCVGNLLLPLLWIGVVKFRRTAHAGYLQVPGGDVTLELRDVLGLKLGARGKVHRPEQATQFKGGKVVSLCEVENLRQLPRRTSQGRKSNHQVPAGGAQVGLQGGIQQRRKPAENGDG